MSNAATRSNALLLVIAVFAVIFQLLTGRRTA
jgi:hypothetical protein